MNGRGSPATLTPEQGAKCELNGKIEVAGYCGENGLKLRRERRTSGWRGRCGRTGGRWQARTFSWCLSTANFRWLAR